MVYPPLAGMKDPWLSDVHFARDGSGSLLKAGPCGQELRGGDRRKPPQRPDRRTGQGNYSGQPVKAA